MKKIIILLILAILINNFHNESLNNEKYVEQDTILDKSISKIFGTSDEKITIYTYNSLVAYGENSTKADEEIFGTFTDLTGITVEVQRLGDAYDALTRAMTEKNNPIADIIIGVDNSMVFQAIEADIFEQYTSKSIGNISSDLISALDPENYITPYDYGLIVPLYKNDADFGDYSMDNLYLDNLTDPSLVERFVTQDPTLSSTGLGFLLAEYAISEKILNNSWQDWWKEVKDDIDIKPSWDAAFSAFSSDAANIDIMISYSTDLAYSAYFDYEIDTGIALLKDGDQSNAWLQIEGIGLVKNAPNSEGAKAFIDYFLDNHSQSWIPTNNWMLPANDNANLHPVFEEYAVNHSQVNILNNLFTREELKILMSTILEEWETIMTAGTIPSFELTSTLFVLIAIFTIQKIRNRKIQ